MESRSKQISISNTQDQFLNEDPNITISDDEDEITVLTQVQQKIKNHGRWTKQEQLLFLKHLIYSKNDFIENLLKYLPDRNKAQIQVHTNQFIQMCKNECSVSKTKQQNKTILKSICQNYGYYPSDYYLCQLEGFIFEPPFDFSINRKPCKLLGTKVKRRSNKTPHSGNVKKKQIKEAIFSISKTSRKTKVINIVTINVLANNSSMIDQTSTVCSNYKMKSSVPNPFNINFDTEIFNSNINNEIDMEREGETLNENENENCPYKDEMKNYFIHSQHEHGYNDIHSQSDVYESIN